MEQMINSLGFPIACVCALGYYFVQKDKASREDINKLPTRHHKDIASKLSLWYYLYRYKYHK